MNGVSRSVTTTAISTVPAGGAKTAIGGETLSPSQVNFFGISPPGLHAVLARPKTPSVLSVAGVNVPAADSLRGGAVAPGLGRGGTGPRSRRPAAARSPARGQRQAARGDEREGGAGHRPGRLTVAGGRVAPRDPSVSTPRELLCWATRDDSTSRPDHAPNGRQTSQPENDALGGQRLLRADGRSGVRRALLRRPGYGRGGQRARGADERARSRHARRCRSWPPATHARPRPWPRCSRW